MTDQSDSFERSPFAAVAVKSAAIIGAFQAVVLDKAHHYNRVNRALFEEFENFNAVGFGQKLQAVRSRRRLDKTKALHRLAHFTSWI